MYARRAALVTSSSLKRKHKVCGRNHTEFSCALRIHDFVRNFGTAPERSDVYNNYDRNTAENQSGDSFYSQIDQFYGTNLGEFQQWQNPSRVYEKRFNSGSFNQDNHSDYNDGNLKIDRGELNQGPNRVHGRSSVLQHVIGEVKRIENINGLISRGSLGTPPHNHDGVHWENSRGDFAGGSNCRGSYSRNEDTPVQTVALNYHSDERNYQQNLGAFQSGEITGSQTTNDMKFNAGSVEVSQQGKLEDRGELNQRSNRVHGQNSVLQRVIGEVKQIENINGLGSRGSLGTPPHNHDGVHWENSRGDFAGGSNYPGSYSRNEAMPVQNVALNYHSDKGNYQWNSGAFQSGGITDSQTTTGMKFNAGSVEVSQEGKLEDRGELNQSSNRVHGQNSVLQHVIGEVKQIENFNGLGSRGSLETPPHNHDGVHWENSSEDFAGGSNYPGSYCRNEDMPVQNVALNYHSDERNYQQNMGGGITDSQTTTDMKFNAGSVEVSQESKLEDLDKFTMEGKLKEAVELLGLLRRERVQVELPRYTALMRACGENEALDMAKSVHEHLLNSGVHLETSTFNQILEMYSKCGSMNNAFQVFDQMPMRNLTTWDIMISWLAKNDLGEDSLELFAEFKRSGLKPDGEMFIGVFSACGVLCDTVEGMLHFESMIKDYGIVPTMNHYVGIVGMLGNAGCLDEALEFIEKMPVEPSVAIWETLMKFCRIHGNTVLGDRCADFVALLDPSRLNEQSQAGLIPISAADIAREKEKKKLSGQNPLDIRSRVHEYRAGDRSPDNDRIYELLRGLRQQMKEVGYVPETKFVLHDVDIEVKEEALMAHSERLAAAQGFLTSAARSPLRIIKNLRFCGDCHNAFKIISKIVGREITARDSKRFHHFRDGSCSCNDFW